MWGLPRRTSHDSVLLFHQELAISHQSVEDTKLNFECLLSLKSSVTLKDFMNLNFLIQKWGY